MNIAAEKQDIIKRFEELRDPSLIQAIKNLLDFGLSKQVNDDLALQQAIERGLADGDADRVRPHDEVMAEFKKRYGLEH